MGAVGLATDVTDKVNAVEALTRLNDSMVGQELKMISLKVENEKLKKQLAKLR